MDMRPPTAHGDERTVDLSRIAVVVRGAERDATGSARISALGRTNGAVKAIASRALSQ
jgi:hypothetical protein